MKPLLADDKVTRLKSYQESLEPADQGTVYMQDLESALYYMIKKEASAKTDYTEDEDNAIRSVITIIGLVLYTVSILKRTIYFRRILSWSAYD